MTCPIFYPFRDHIEDFNCISWALHSLVFGACVDYFPHLSVVTMSQINLC